MTDITRTHHKYSLAIYLLLAMGITWLGWIPGLIIGAKQGYIMPNFNTYADLFKSGFVDARHMWLGIAFQLAVYGPLVGGVVATWMDAGREGLSDLWKRMTRWSVGGKWYLSVLIITFLVTGIPVILFGVTSGFVLSTIPLAIILFVFLAQLLTSGLGEEPGWRGFLLPRLQARFDGEKYIWILGLLWGIWHYPIVIFQTLSMMQNVTVPQMIITIVMSLAGQTISLIGMVFIYVWLYNRTNSIFVVIVFHALSNLFSYWLPSFLTNPQVVGVLPALIPWLIVIILQKKYGKENFPGKPLQIEN